MPMLSDDDYYLRDRSRAMLFFSSEGRMPAHVPEAFARKIVEQVDADPDAWPEVDAVTVERTSVERLFVRASPNR